MSKDSGLYFLDNEAQKKVKKARALDESLLGRRFNKKKYDEGWERIFGKNEGKKND